MNKYKEQIMDKREQIIEILWIEMYDEDWRNDHPDPGSD